MKPTPTFHANAPPGLGALSRRPSRLRTTCPLSPWRLHARLLEPLHHVDVAGIGVYFLMLLTDRQAETTETAIGVPGIEKGETQVATS